MYIRCILSLKLCNSLYLQQPGPEHCGARVEGEDHPGWSADSWIQCAALQPGLLVSRVRTILLYLYTAVLWDTYYIYCCTMLYILYLLLSKQDFWYLEYVQYYYYLLSPYHPNNTTSNPTTTTTPTTSHLSTTWDQMYTNEPTAGLSATSDPALILGGKCSYTRVYTVYTLHYTICL